MSNVAVLWREKLIKRSTSEVLHRGMKFRQLVALSLRFLQPAARDALNSRGVGCLSLAWFPYIKSQEHVWEHVF